MRKLGGRRAVDEDGSAGVDEEEEMSGTPPRRLSAQQDEYNSSSSISDSYRFSLVGVRRLGECAGM